MAGTGIEKPKMLLFLGENSHGEGGIVFLIFKKKILFWDFLLENKKDFTFLHGSVLLHGVVQQNEKALKGTGVNSGSCECLINHR